MVDKNQRLQMIDRYEQGAKLFSEALQEVPEPLLDKSPTPGKWSIRQIAIHMADAEVMLSARLRCVAGQDGAKIPAFDQDKWASAMAYDSQPLGHTQELFRVLRRANAAMLRHLPEEAWNHRGIHEERGPQSLEDLVNSYIQHGEHHTLSIREIHEKLASGKAA